MTLLDPNAHIAVEPALFDLSNGEISLMDIDGFTAAHEDTGAHADHPGPDFDDMQPLMSDTLREAIHERSHTGMSKRNLGSLLLSNL